VRPAASSEAFENALRNTDKINKNLLPFDIVTGVDDKIVGGCDDVRRPAYTSKHPTLLYGVSRRNS
jgi:hypothetical protein